MGTGAYGSFCIPSTSFSYYVTNWPFTPDLEKQWHIPLIMVVNCTRLYDPGAYGSFCILPTTFSYFVTIRPWPLTLKNNKHPLLSMMFKCTKFCKILRLTVRPKRPGQTDGRRYTIIRLVKDMFEGERERERGGSPFARLKPVYLFDIIRTCSTLNSHYYRVYSK